MVLKGSYDLVVFDEINIALRDAFIRLEDFLKFSDERPVSQEWILTGRGALPEIIENAINTVRSFGYDYWLEKTTTGSKVKSIVKELA